MSGWGERELPPGWAWAKLGDIADVQLGKMLDAKRQTGKHPMEYLRNVNVQWHRVDLGDLLTMDVAPDERDRYSVRAGDLLVCEGGEPGRCSIVPPRADGYAYQKALHRVRPGVGVSNAYLAYVFETMARTGVLAPLFTGSTIRHLPREKMLELRLPLPPSDEQVRIADALAAQLSVFDKMVEGLRLLVGEVSVSSDSRLGRLRSSMLLAASQGRLVPQDSSAIPAEIVVNEIAAARDAAPRLRRTRARKRVTEDSE